MRSVLCIGGFDPSGGAGLAADLKTLSALGVHGYGLVTTVTAQNSREFSGHTPVSANDFRRQWRAVIDERIPEVIKIGLLPNDEILDEVFSCLREVPSKVIFDPVLATSSGFDFRLDIEKVRSYLKQVDLLTPNRPEAEKLLSDPHPQDCGAKSVLLKGGHGGNAEACTDLFYDRQGSFALTGRRRSGNFRGTGCTLGAAIAAFYTESRSWREAVVQAKSYVAQSMLETPYLSHRPWPHTSDFPWIGEKLPPSPDCGAEPLGFYPIVDRLHWLEKLIALGTTTAQLRIKDLQGEELEDEIRRAIELARKTACRLFINDHWRLAIKLGAYGVHLGQEDLQKLSPQEIHILKDSGLRLGISTHSFEEAARAHAFSPSYIALGPVYETTAKKMKFAPQGLERVTLWKKLLPYPLVAIGGMNIERGRLAYAAGADSVAMMSDVTQAANPPARIKEWLQIGTL